MKPLFNENLSPKLPRLLAMQFPGSLHVRDCSLKGATDEESWEYAGAKPVCAAARDRTGLVRKLPDEREKS
jgi:predicted nuclease of predicted toxin-antitoxin system